MPDGWLLTGANQLVQPLAPNKARRSNKKSKKAKKREEEPSIFQVEIPLDMMSDSVIARPSSAEIEAAHSTHQPIYVEIDDEQQSALAGGNMLLGLPEGEEVVFINVDKHERLARRSEALREMDDVLASME